MSLSQGGAFSSCAGSVDLGVLVPHLAGAVIEEVAVAAGPLLMLARAKAATAACPGCGTVPGRIHSRCERRLADAAVGGRQVEILLTVRRFFCAPLDLLEGRDAQPLAEWLAPRGRGHLQGPRGVVRRGRQDRAPVAVQVADRFHLWQNLARAAGKCVAAYRSCLAEPVPAPTEEQATTAPEPEPAGQPIPRGSTPSAPAATTN